MSMDMLITLGVVGVMLIALVREMYAPDVVLFAALGALLVSGVLSIEEALSGFSNPGMITVALLFVVAYAAQASGILEFFADRIMGDGGGGKRPLLRMMTPVIAMSAFLNNTPIVAMFVPTIRDWALKNRLAPSRFLMPLSFASIFGGICTLIGTSTNLVVNGMLIKATGFSLSMFELAWVGLPCAVVGTLFMVTIGRRLLPNNRDLEADTGRTGREYVVEMQVPAGSRLIGKSVEEGGLRRLHIAYLAKLQRDNQIYAPVRPEEMLREGDILYFSGDADAAVKVQRIEGLSLVHGSNIVREMEFQGEGRVLEAVVSRSSPMLGKTLKEGNFRARYDAAVLSVHRNGERLQASLGELELKPGDTLLLLAGTDFFKRWNHSRDFYLLSRVGKVTTPNRRKTIISLSALVAMVALSAIGGVDIVRAAILAVVVLLLSRAVTVVEARRSLELNVLIVIAAALGISKALEKTGAASFLAEGIVGGVDGLGPLGLLIAIYLATSILTEVITNNAAAALVFPVAMAAAVKGGMNPVPFAVAVAVAASASFATPIGYQTNLMVYGPGGYRFADFLKVGIPLNLLFAVISMLIIPQVWPLVPVAP